MKSSFKFVNQTLKKLLNFPSACLAYYAQAQDFLKILPRFKISRPIFFLFQYFQAWMLDPLLAHRRDTQQHCSEQQVTSH